MKTSTVDGGDVKRLSVAVVVDGSGDTAASYKPRSAAEMAQISALVKSAMGFDQTRGDQVQVTNMAFAHIVDPEAGTAAPKPLLGLDSGYWFKIIEAAIMGVTALLIGLFVARPLINRMFTPISMVPAGVLPNASPVAGALAAPPQGALPTESTAPAAPRSAARKRHRCVAHRRPGARKLHQEGRRSRQRASRGSAGDHPYLAASAGIAGKSDGQTRQIPRQGRCPLPLRGGARRHRHAVAGEENSAKLWSMMDEEEIKEISQIMSNLGSVSSLLIEKLLVDFVSSMSGTGSLMGSYESTERLIAKFMPEDKVSQIMEEIRGPAGRTMWDKLANVNETVLANYLKNEYPQTVCVVLSKIKPEHAARVLGSLPEEFALEVVQRMLRMESVQKDILDKVEQTLRIEFMSNLARTAKRDAHEQMAEIFNNFDRQTESRFITALEERSRDSAERIKALMFTFEDLSKLDPGSIQTLLRNVEKTSWASH